MSKEKSDTVFTTFKWGKFLLLEQAANTNYCPIIAVVNCLVLEEKISLTKEFLSMDDIAEALKLFQGKVTPLLDGLEIDGCTFDDILSSDQPSSGCAFKCQRS